MRVLTFIPAAAGIILLFVWLATAVQEMMVTL